MASGQKPSITSIIKTYSNRLFGFIRGRVRSEEDAEDILQDVWVSLNNVIDLETIENIGAWLFRSARNRIVDEYRKRKEETWEDSTDEELSVLTIMTDELHQDEFLSEVFWQELIKALETLPEKQRDVFVKNELDGLTLQEIADEYGEKLKTIISRKRYAVQQLRKQLQDFYDELNEL